MIAYYSRDFRCGFCNKPYLDWFECDVTAEDAVGLHARELIGEELFSKSEPFLKKALSGEWVHFERSRKSSVGEEQYLLVSYKPDIGKSGDVIGVYILASDVTAIKNAENELKLAASVYYNLKEGVLITDPNGHILSVNKAFTEITGFSANEAIGKNPNILKSFRHSPEFYCNMWRAIESNGKWSGEIWNRRKNGEVYLEWLTITRISGQEGAVVRYVAVFGDIAGARAGNERLMHLAFYDVLTDLPNRALLMERLEQMVSRIDREPRLLAVMFLDLDGFKLINDSFGHKVGDELLRAVAKALCALVRQSDTVARLGGDEFVILLDNPQNEHEIANIAQRVITAINKHWNISGKSVHVGVSIGVVIYPKSGISSGDMIKYADAAMYAAKSAGKNTYRFFDDSTPQPTSHSGADSSWDI